MRMFNTIKGKIPGFHTKGGLTPALVLGIGAGLLLTFGRILEAGGSLSHMGIGSLLQLLVCSMLFTAAGGVLFARIDYKKEVSQVQGKLIFSRRCFFLFWAGLFVCWIPVFLAYYPVIWAYDVGQQVPTVRGMIPTTQHPLLHTLYLDTVVRIGGRPGHYEPGMCLLSFSQMLAMSGMYAYGIEHTRRWGCSKWCRIALFGFFAFLPFHSILSVSMTKDVLFSGCWLICVLKLFELIDRPEAFFRSGKSMASFVLFLGLMLLLRSNAVYAFIPGMAVGIVVLRRLQWKRFAVLCLCGLCLYGSVEAILFSVMDAQKGYPQEPYCVPMQCLVGTALRHPELIPEYGSGELLMDVIPRDWFSEELERDFDPHLADPVKERWWRLEGEAFSPGHLLKVWVSYGIQYPLDYLDIWGTLTLGAWYPLDKTHGHIYDSYESERQGYLLTDYKNVPGIDMERPASRWPWLEGMYEKCATENLHEKIPVVSLVFAPASYCWLMLFCILLAWYRRRYRELLPLGLLFFYWCTVLLGPAVLVRYLYPVMVTVPFFLCRLRIRRSSSLNNPSDSVTM